MLIDSVDVSVSYVFDARLVPKVTQTKLDRRCVWENTPVHVTFDKPNNGSLHIDVTDSTCRFVSIMSVTLSLDSITPPPTGM